MTEQSLDPRDDIAARDVGPVVPLPRTGISGAAIAIGCGLLAIVLFLVLDSYRRALETQRTAPVTAAQPLGSAPPLVIPPAAPVATLIPAPVASPSPQPISPMARAAPAPPPMPIYTAPPPLRLQPEEPPRAAAPVSRGEPALVVDLGPGDAPANAKGAEGAAAGAGDDQAVRATIIRNRSSLVPQGSLIPAVLETPIDSSRPGLVRALVSRDVRGFDGSRVLIPRGSRLIGEAKGDIQPGQKRVLVTWTRLIRPDGVAIRIGSPGADSLGGAGLAGSVNTHFFERFTNAVLQSALTVGVNLASRPGNGSVIVGLPGQIGTTVQPLFPSNNIPPTIKVRQGTEISVFVARDLDFGGVAPRQ